MEPRFPIGEETLWFVFERDQQFGPFVTSELALQLNKGEISEESFVWAQGFSDWIPVAEVPGLAAYRLDLKSFEQAEAVEKLQDSMSLSKIDFVNTQNAETKEIELKNVELWTARQIALNEKYAKVENLLNNTAVIEAAAKATALASGWSRHKYKLAALGSFAVVLISAAIVQNSKQDPFIELNLAASDRAALKNAMTQSRLISGTTAEIVLASAASESPRFAISTNVENGTKIEVRIDGIPGKILGQSRFAMKTILTPKDGWVLTERLTGPSSQTFPPGIYKVSVKDQLKDNLLTTKTFFLGSVPGGDFETALRNYQNELQDQSQMEIMELTQLNETVSKILNETSQWLAQNDAKKDVGQKWQDRLSRFRILEGQLKSLELQWKSEPMASQIVFIESYRTMADLFEQLRKGHEEISRYTQLTDLDQRTAARDAYARTWLRAQTLSESISKQINSAKF